ncbi:MAG: bacitracin ABC transporter permease [Chitinivibrionales bacterium]|nr:bacitracin ABC transporter permease [Chitinivibrionales bacterium]
MRSFLIACSVEYMKVRRSKIVWLTIAALCMAPLFGALFVTVLRNPSLAAGNEALTAKAAMTGFSADWPSFLNLIAQALGVGGVVVFGFAASWIFGREYFDHTIKDMLILPVSRTTIVFAKFAVCMLWCCVIAITVSIVGITTGFLLGLPGWEFASFMAALRRIFFAGMLAALLCPPVFFVASAGKGYLGSLGFVILTVVIAQIIGALGFGAYVPWAVPALYSGLGSEAGGGVNWISYVIVVITSVAGMTTTVYWWNYADQYQ